MEYQQLKEYVFQGHNIFLTGPGGVGKSYFINQLKAEYSGDEPSKMSVTSTTGVSAFNLGAQTIHSFSGIGAMKPRDNIESILKKVRKNKNAMKRIHECEILVIDEISMLGENYLEMMDAVFQRIRGRTTVMGGIQIIFTGDFLQLPPVNDKFCFHSDVWKALQLKTIYLTKMYRVKDPHYTGMLERIRMARHTPDDNKELYKRFFAYKEYIASKDDEKNADTIRPTFLYSKKVDVHEKNMEELEKNPNELLLFRPMVVKGEAYEKYESDERKKTDLDIKENYNVLYLKVGAQVMLTVNLDCDAGLVNGSRGIVRDYQDGSLVVEFLNGNKMGFTRHEFVTEEDGKVLFKVMQFPFILAYALSIHKVQGSTLDFAVIDIGYSVFETSMSYVALSRVRSLEGLFLEAYQPHKIFCSQDALSFYENLS
uniref:AAA+ ATPase domain-containing protein n=1 Tax=viral metagenome TaxID=1070528 RepID=A0A6C0KGU6_9ZZZZ